MKQQAKKIAELIWIFRKTRWNKFEKECYIMSARWFDKWAIYVDFYKYFNVSKGTLTSAYYTADNEDLEFSAGKEHPGIIDNQCLIADSKEYYHNFTNPQALCNFILRDSLEENRDYYIVTKDIWDYLHSIYGGMALRRDCIILSPNGRIKIDTKMEKVFLNQSYYEKVKITFIKNQQKCESPKRIYFPCNYTFRNLKNHIIQSFKFLHGKDEDSIRLWKPSISFSEFMHYYRSQTIQHVFFK